MSSSLKSSKQKAPTIDEMEAIHRYFEAVEQQGIDPPLPPEGHRFDKGRTHRFVTESIARREKKKSVYRWGSIAAGLLIFFLSAGIYYSLTSRDSLNVAFVHVISAKGEVKEVLLPDGSLVWLNADSELSYPEAFEGDTREIRLTGEAYIEVKEEKEKPFVVVSDVIHTRVLGTKFYVKAYADERCITVGLLTGKVTVESHDNRKSIRSETLRAGERVVYSRADASHVKSTHDQITSDIAWKDGNLIFQNTPLPEVVRTLERHYDVTIHIEPLLRQRMLYADFDNLSIQSVLKILPILLSCEMMEEEGTYYLRSR